ncbi:MAG: SDR family NAD(P)-dependent oxidoreductase [Rhodospirillaceae bacterium]|nr:SDR family NAD(P)-dependent oxidoreductase [Rhodospirillaceae bacterium]
MESLSLEGRIALVTGAGSGMGAAHAAILAERGAHVIVQDVEKDSRAERSVAHIRAAGGRAEAMQADVSDAPRLSAQIADAIGRHGVIDILVNNAGITGLQMPFLEINEAFFDRMFAVHVKGAFFTSQAVIPAMRARGYGKIINIASNFAMHGGSGMAHYTSAKGALLGLTKALAKEFGPDGVRINAVAPGLVRTPMTERLGDEGFETFAGNVPLRRLARPRDVAETVAFLAAPASDMITGQTVAPSGGDPIVGI